MTPIKPSLNLLRSLTDEHVLRALMHARRLTRAELAAATGISKPTISESVRRLSQTGIIQDTGERTTGRGRAGSYYALAQGIGSALVTSVAPEGIVAESVDAHGEVMSRASASVRRPARPAEVARALVAVSQDVQGARSPTRLAVVSAADPVDRTTGRLVHLPDAPFLLGELSPAEALGGLVQGPVLVDNDVNWAARAEREACATSEMEDFAYVYLGEGLGSAIVNDGQVRRGFSGLAGEIAHLVTVGPRGQAIQFTDVFNELGFRRSGSSAVDVAALLQAVHPDHPGRHTVLEALSRAVCGVLAAAVALSDPRLIVIGGTWGTQPEILEALAAQFARLPRHVPIQAARITKEAPLVGARNQALRELRAAIVAAARDPGTAPAGMENRGPELG